MATPDELTLAVAKAVLIVMFAIGLVFYLAWVAAKRSAETSESGEVDSRAYRHSKEIQVSRT